MKEERGGNLQHQAEHTRSHHRMSALGYMVILFAVAFLLLLMAYFQQQRANSEATDALKQSASAWQSVQNLMQDNEELQEEVDRLELEANALNRDKKELEAQVEALERTSRAMDYFWQVNEAYVKGRYGLCRDLIQEMENAEQGWALKDYLPAESVTDTDRFSPAERYAEICERLG